MDGFRTGRLVIAQRQHTYTLYVSQRTGGQWDGGHVDLYTSCPGCLGRGLFELGWGLAKGDKC
jgi:hypothetical protein